MTLKRRGALRHWILAVLMLTLMTSVTACGAQSDEMAKATSPPLSSEEHEQLVQEEDARALDDLRSAYPDVELPSVSRVKFVSSNEWPEAIAACLNEEGFDVSVKDGGVGGMVLYDQQEPYALAMYVCKIKYPLDPKFNVPFSESQLDYLYHYYTGELTTCLEDAGYSIADPPSRQKFVETYGAGNWAPYNSVRDVTEWSELNRKCPQLPDGLFG